MGIKEISIGLSLYCKMSGIWLGVVPWGLPTHLLVYLEGGIIFYLIDQIAFLNAIA